MGEDPNSNAEVAYSHVTGAQMSLCVFRFLLSSNKHLAALGAKQEVLGIQRL